MNGKSYSLPCGMLFKKYYCAKCGAKLEKEKTHRVVTKNDPDYFRYHSYGKFPRRDYDVYNHRFRCPDCGARVSYDEQCILAGIQNKQGHAVLSSFEIKSHYAAGKARHQKQILLMSILSPIVFAMVFFALFCISNPEKSPRDYMPVAFFCAVAAVLMAVAAVIRYKGSFLGINLSRSYSYEKEAQLKRLHTYSAHNRSRIAVAGKCYCFYCKAVLDSSEITDYADHGQTAICPKCGIDSIIPDSIDEPIDTKTVAELNQYWF